MDRPAHTALGVVSVFALLVVRGLLLWILIPVGFVLWLLVFGGLLHVGLGHFLGWLDLNLIAALQRVLIVADVTRAVENDAHDLDRTGWTVDV